MEPPRAVNGQEFNSKIQPGMEEKQTRRELATVSYPLQMKHTT